MGFDPTRLTSSLARAGSSRETGFMPPEAQTPEIWVQTYSKHFISFLTYKWAP